MVEEEGHAPIPRQLFQQSAQLEWAALKMRSAVYHGSRG